MEKSQLTVQGMSCGHCVKSIEEKVEKLDGISSVKVDLRASKVYVEYDNSIVSLFTIKEVIEELGYEVQ